MASGRNHQHINTQVLSVVTGAVAGVAFYNAIGRPAFAQAELPWPVILSVAAGFVMGTFLVTPDLDLAEQHVLAKRNWGWLGFIWVPYGHLFSHRGLSHGWFVGPLTRILYLLGLVAVVWGATYAVAARLGYPMALPTEVAAYVRFEWVVGAAGALAGFYASQWLHLLADSVGPMHGLRRLAAKLTGRR